MKRDMDLVRQILFELEKVESDGKWLDLKVEGVGERVLSEHVRLAADAGLIDAIDLSTMSGTNWKAKRLTWEGHEFLAAIRDQGIWEKTKRTVLEKTGGMTVAALHAYALHLLKEKLGLDLGGSG